MFDLSRDAGEETDLAGAQSYRLRQFLPRLTAYAEKEWQSAAEPMAMTDEDRKRLDALGYVN